jgi:hypothetical protein
MLARFAAAVIVAAVAIALGATLAPFFFIVHPEGFAQVTRLWCVIPALWGVWAMLAPRAWVPGRLPHWGAIFGLGIGVVVLLVLNAPERVFYLHLPIEARVGGVLAIVAFYYGLWLLVRRVYLSLEARSAVTPTQPPM